MHFSKSIRKSSLMSGDKSDTSKDSFLVEVEQVKHHDTYSDSTRKTSEELNSLVVHPTVLKYGSLSLLAIQNAGLIIAMRYVRTRPGEMFVSSTAVVMSEIFKMLACLCVIFVNEGYSITKWMRHLYTNICLLPMDCLRISVPSVIYVIQNNLMFIAISHLDAATFQVTYQLKILTTAILSVIVLKAKLSSQQWVALVVLFFGVALIQLPSENAAVPNPSPVEQNVFVGLVAVLIACLLSGFAGVYLEKILKGTNPSIWLRNVQLGFLGALFGLCTVFLSDWSTISEKGFFNGYDSFVWLVVCLQSFGGLIVAVAVKYADNILKGFATSLAIIVSCIVSVFVFDFHITYAFSIGTTLVLIATYMYSKYVLPK